MAEKSWKVWSSIPLEGINLNWQPVCNLEDKVKCVVKGYGCRYFMPEQAKEKMGECRALEMIIREVDGEAKIGGGRIREPGYAGMDDNEEAMR